MVKFTRDKDIIAALDDKEKNRLIAVLISCKGIDAFKIDWEAAAERFGAGSTASMRNHSPKTINKIKIFDDDLDTKDAETGAADGGTPLASKKRTSPVKKRKNDSDGDEVAVESAKKKKKTSTKQKTSAKKMQVIAQDASEHLKLEVDDEEDVDFSLFD